MTDGTFDPSAEGAALCVYDPQEGVISSFEWITDAEAEGKVLLNENDVETVCLLSKLHEAKHHINVKVDMDELDLPSAEAKATYKEIEEWVQEHYGFHVTNLAYYRELQKVVDGSQSVRK